MRDHFFRLSLVLLVASGVFAPVSASFAQPVEAPEVTPEPDGDESDETPDIEPSEPSEPSGASEEVVFWSVQGSDEQSRAEFATSVGAALADERGTHLLNDAEFEAWVVESNAQIPRCFKGLEPCVSARSMAFSALGISLIVEVDLGGDEGEVTAAWSAQDARGDVVEEGLARKSTLREAAFSVVAELFDATGAIRFESDPPGARLTIDETEVGTTPYLARLPVGQHNFSMQLESFTIEKGSIEVTRAKSTVVRRSLQPQKSTLIVSDAPDGAGVYVNNIRVGSVGERIELDPGNHVFEVRADGYSSRHDAVELAPGETQTRSAPLELSNPFLRSFGAEAIARYPYALRLSFEHGFQSTTLRDARATDPSFDFVSFAGDAIDPPDEPRYETLHGNGVRFDLGYSFKNFGITVLSLTYYVGSVDEPVFVETPQGAVEPGRLTGLHRLQVRPFQLSYRHFVDNFVPFVELGTGLDFQWVSIEGDFDDVTLGQTKALVALAFGAQYYFTPQLFATARYGLQGYFDSGIGADHLLSIGVGLSLDSLFGFSAKPPDAL